MTVQAIHAVDKHEHNVCTATTEHHIHDKDIDCSLFHFQINQNAIDFSSNYQFIDYTLNEETIPERSFQSYTTYLFSKSSRAPPSVILY